MYPRAKGSDLARKANTHSTVGIDNPLHSFIAQAINPKYNMKTFLSTQKAIRFTLSSLLLFMAINALAGGYYAMAGARNVPLEWLKGSLFDSYFIPGVVLFFGVGASLFIAAIAVFKSSPIDRKAGYTAGAIMLLWLGIQLAIIGYVSWMQPATATAALIILFLTWILPRHK